MKGQPLTDEECAECDANHERGLALTRRVALLMGWEPGVGLKWAAIRKIVSYFCLNVGDWKNWLATNGPILARLDVDLTWDHATATGGNLDVYSLSGRGGHAIAIVGYTADRFIVRNSWGSGWGDDGFGYASMGYAMSAFTESYGVRV